MDVVILVTMYLLSNDSILSPPFLENTNIKIYKDKKRSVIFITLAKCKLFQTYLYKILLDQHKYFDRAQKSRFIFFKVNFTIN